MDNAFGYTLPEAHELSDDCFCLDCLIGHAAAAQGLEVDAEGYFVEKSDDH